MSLTTPPYFDVTRLPKLGTAFWDSHSFKRLVVAYTGTLDHPVHSYGRERLERVRAIDVESELLPMMGGQVTVDPDALIGDAWQAVESILALDDSEMEFVDRLQLGDLRLDLLLPGESELREKLEKWPPLQWKVLNARRERACRPWTRIC